MHSSAKPVGRVFPTRLIRDFETAARRFSMVTPLLDWTADDFGQKRFRDETGFGMMRRYRGQCTAVSYYDSFPFAFLKSNVTAESLKHVDRMFDSLRLRFVSSLIDMILCRGSTNLPQTRSQLFGGQRRAEDRQSMA